MASVGRIYRMSSTGRERRALAVLVSDPAWYSGRIQRLRVTAMPDASTSTIEYRGYTLTAVQQSPGWRMHIHPGPGLLRTHPDVVSAVTKEEAFAKARAAIDLHLSS